MDGRALKHALEDGAVSRARGVRVLVIVFVLLVASAIAAAPATPAQVALEAERVERAHPTASSDERAASAPSARAERPAVLDHTIDPAAPPPAFRAVNALLRKAKCIRADFADEKTIRVLKRPLRSSGSLVYSAELGLYRKTTAPFELELLVTRKGIAQRDAAHVIERLDVDKQPLAKGFIDAFLLVFSGQDDALAGAFELSFMGDESAWSIGFVPRTQPLSKYIASLVISGEHGVLETLSVLEVNGDHTLTRFARVVTDVELGPDERKLWFGWQD